MLFNKKFDENPHKLQFHPIFKWYNRNHAHFLSKINVSTVLEINCKNKCIEEYKNDEDFKSLKKVEFYDQNQMAQYDRPFDWIAIRYNSVIKK